MHTKMSHVTIFNTLVKINVNFCNQVNKFFSLQTE